jgi:nucleoside 2-deoxyribosyltransferase
MRVYLAGPDVFLPDPLARAAMLKALCARYGLIGVSPLDPYLPAPDDWAGLPDALRIARQNEAHIASCDALVANLTPFRGPSADVGTVFELGFMRALGRPVFGWSNDASHYADRTRAFLGPVGDGMEIESFDLADNLMIEGAITSSGGAMLIEAVPAPHRWTRLSAFERCLAAVAAWRLPRTPDL